MPRNCILGTLANRSGDACEPVCERQHLFRIEAGNTNPQLETLRRIAAALGRSVRELFCGDLTGSATGPRAGAYKVVDRVLESGDEAALSVLSSAILTCQVLLDRRSRVADQQDQYFCGRKLPKLGEKIMETIRSSKRIRVQRATGEWITIGPDGIEKDSHQSTPNDAETRDHDNKQQQ